MYIRVSVCIFVNDEEQSVHFNHLRANSESNSLKKLTCTFYLYK